MQAAITTSRTVSRSFTQPRAPGVRFGDDAVRVRPIGELQASAGYDPELAYVLSVISAWAYADEKALAAKLRYYGIAGARVRRVSIQNDALLVVATAYLVQSSDGSVGILAYRGTDPASFITLLADAGVMHRRFHEMGVHAGFHANVEALWDDVHGMLDAARRGIWIEADGTETPLEKPMTALYLTGHSLGGAMAVLTAARLFADGYEPWNPEGLVRGVYTYGQPMVGDDDFARFCSRRFDDRHFRHVYRQDLVPHLPPESGLSYAHSGVELRAGGLTCPWAPSELASERAGVASAIVEVLVSAVEARFVPKPLLRGLSIDDHMPDNYLHVSRYTLAPDSVVEPASRSSLVWLAQPAARWIGKAGATASRLVARLEAALPEGLIRSA